MKTPFDFEKALIDPAAFFRQPEDIRGEASLARDQKIELLRRWEYDARLGEVATEENMPGGNGRDLLARVLAVLRDLGYRHDSSSSAPTKEGGG